MKKNLLYLLTAVLAAVGCAKNSPESEPEYSQKDTDGFLQEVFWDQTEVPEYKVISEGTFTYEERAERAFGPDEDLDDETLAAKKEFLEQCEEILKDEPDNAVWADYIIFEYVTIDQNNNSLTLSAYMDFSTAKTPDHVAFCCPYTHTLEKECATENEGGYEAKTYLANGLFIIPDGQGFGSNKDHVQTYLNHELHARQYYDALLSALDIYFNWKKHRELKSDWTLRLFGASQGAGDAIALHRYLDTKYKLLNLTPYYESGKWDEANALCGQYGYPKGSQKIEVPLCQVHRFQYSYVCCGPYCPEETMKTFREWKKNDYPCVIPLVIKSMRACDAVFADTYPEEAFFSPRWNEIKTQWTWGIEPLDDIYLRKTLPSDELNEHICRVLGIPRHETPGPTVPLGEMLSDAMMKTDSPIYRDLLLRLREQDLTTGWKPRTPTKLHYCEDDNVVPYVNTVKLIKLFESNNCSYKTAKYNAKSGKKHTAHVDCCEDYIKSKWTW